MSATQFANWTKLPSIFVVDILSYLQSKDRINASTVCKRWRTCFYHPSLWSEVHFRIQYGHRRKTKYLSDVCATFVKHATIELDVRLVTNVKEFDRIMNVLENNINLETLIITPNMTQIMWPEREARYSKSVSSRPRSVLSLLNIARRARALKQLSLGCITDFTNGATELVTILSHCQFSSLEALHIESLKEDSNYYEIGILPQDAFSTFSNLKRLGIDYDYVSNVLLRSLADTTNSLTSMVINVHSVDRNRQKISNATWQRLVNRNRQLNVTLNLLHSPDGANALLDILVPAMPLAHYRQYFCQYLHAAAMTFIASCHHNSLKSICIVDAMTHYKPNHVAFETEENPFVMLAWKCHQLEHFTLIGYELTCDDMIAVARLRGDTLVTLEVPRCCLGEVEEDDVTQEAWITFGATDEEFDKEISNTLGRPWSPLSSRQLHPAVVTDTNAESAYLSQLLRDQL